MSNNIKRTLSTIRYLEQGTTSTIKLTRLKRTIATGKRQDHRAMFTTNLTKLKEYFLSELLC